MKNKKRKVVKLHELSLMSEIIKIIDEDARINGVAKVNKIEVVVGDLSNVLPDALELAFFYFRKEASNLLCEDAKLKIIRETAQAKCQTCLFEFEPDYRIALCPKCGLPDCVLISGETFRIESYEGSDKFENQS